MLESELVDKITAYLDRHRIRYAKEIRMGIGVPDVSINIGAAKSMAMISDYYLLLMIDTNHWQNTLKFRKEMVN